jgi:hypothetical protein
MLDYMTRPGDFIDDFVDNDVLSDYAREDIRAVVIAGNTPKDLVVYLGELARDAVGNNTVKLVMNTKDPLEPIVRGAADRARELGGPFRMGTCEPTQLTDE